jgi:ribosome biogenesis SPOUT family RNA methylase Rps3
MKIARSEKNTLHIRDQPKIIIEHLEPELSRWLLFEYENASNILKKEVWFTNIKKSALKKLKKLGTTSCQSALKVFPHKKLLILDPRAKKTLTPDDLKDSIVVIGGILGEYPPRGRTKTLLTLKAPKAKARNLGNWQFTIDGAAYIAKLVANGKKLESIPIKCNLVLKTKLKPSGVHEVLLPYAYPVVAGRPLISNKLVNYLMGSKNVEITWLNRPLYD